MLKKGAQEQADKMQHEIDNLRKQQLNASKGGGGFFSKIGAMLDSIF